MSKATQNGKAICPCAGWCREVDENMREAAHGREELEHAYLCDGTGKAITSDSEMVKILRARLLEARNETRQVKALVEEVKETLAHPDIDNVLQVMHELFDLDIPKYLEVCP